ncbi:RHD3/Sey1 [Dipodascopsis uninucleata]
MTEDSTSSHQLQIINEDKVFSNEVNSYLSSVGLLDAGLGYHLISVFGSQSTGKSTLLNALFGTRFDVMDETRRSQTTKGIWMSRAKQNQILIMDVEGTDGRERGEDQDFERKAALFALATSEVLIVNIWEHQVGLYQGANMGLLKTVFEVNLNLFQNSKNKSLLLFVIRDHIGVTPLENLAATLISDLNRIWDSLMKPDHLKDAKIDDFFGLQFTTLPHKILQPEKFGEEVKDLEKRFESSDDPNYVFDKTYHRNVPADGWSIYAQNVWEQIELNKDLDLPTQQILVARFRCDEISNSAWDKFEDDLAPVEQMSGIIADLGSTTGIARSSAIELFDSQASRYMKTVYSEKRSDLIGKIDTKLSQVFYNQLALMHKLAIQEFRSKVSTELNKPNYKFIDVIDSSKELIIGNFSSSAITARAEGTSFSFDSPLASLVSDLEEIIIRMRETETKKLTTRLLKHVAVDLDENISTIFKVPSETMWDRVNESFKNSLDSRLQKYKTVNGYDFHLGGTNEEREQASLNILSSAWKVFYFKLKELTKPDNIIMRLREQFEDKFKYDEKGIPRVWRPSDNIDDVYSVALKSTLELIPLFSTAKFSNGEFLAPDENVIELMESEDEIEVENFHSFLSEAQQSGLQSNFKKYADSVYVDAKRGTIQSIRQVPLYFYIMLLILGWNEIMAVLRNPVYFVMLAMISGLVYTLYALNLMGPLTTMTNAALDQAIGIGKERLRQALDVQVSHNNVTEASVDSESIEMSTLDENGSTDNSSTKVPGQF